jgi:hypothetical protein
MTVASSSVGETKRFTGPEKRQYPRIPAKYPICVRFESSSGQAVERYAQTRNVSVEGVFFSCMERLEVGQDVGVFMGIPSAHAASLPAAQLNGKAVVVRCERVEPLEDAGVALKFVEKPSLTTHVSMFD